EITLQASVLGVTKEVQALIDKYQELEKQGNKTNDKIKKTGKEIKDTGEAGTTAAQAIGSALTNFFSKGERVIERVNGLLKRVVVQGQSVGAFLEKLNAGLADVSVELEENRERVTQALAAMASGADEFGSALRAAVNDSTLLDDETLRNYNQALAQANRKAQAFADDAQQRRVDQEIEILELTGKSAEADQLRHDAKILALNEELELARFIGGEAFRDVGALIEQEQKLHKLRLDQDQSRRDEIQRRDAVQTPAPQRGTGAVGTGAVGTGAVVNISFGQFINAGGTQSSMTDLAKALLRPMDQQLTLLSRRRN
ncbi:MAG: hypothetical protein V3R81_07810, partial [Gammaproteobacteria bacterium]